MKNKDKQKTYRERTLIGIYNNAHWLAIDPHIAGWLKQQLPKAINTAISEVLDEVENMVVDYIGDDAERDAARSRLAEIKKGLK